MSEPQDDLGQFFHNDTPGGGDLLDGTLHLPGADAPSTPDLSPGDDWERVGDRDGEVLDQFNKEHPPSGGANLGDLGDLGDLKPTGIVEPEIPTTWMPHEPQPDGGPDLEHPQPDEIGGPEAIN